MGPDLAFRGETQGPRARIASVDFLRGAVMVVMVLDHVRDFAHRDALISDPTDLARTSVPLFLTRWVTHFCAPVFVLLAGAAAFLHAQKLGSRAALAKFLLTRGLWLVFLELTAVHLGAFFELDYRFLGPLQVIWAIGVSMMALAALVHLPLAAITAVGAAMILFHNLLDGVQVPAWRGPESAAPSFAEGVWILLHQPGLLPIVGFPGPVAMVIYPLVPWIGVLAAGYSLGRVYEWEPERRARFLVRFGVGMMVAFALLRAGNLYGDPRPWAAQGSAAFTVLSFFNVTKYPPSLLFLLVTLGPALVVLALVETRPMPGLAGHAIVTFGRVPLFYYLLQWPAAHALTLLASAAVAKPTSHLLASALDMFTRPPPAGAGFDLPGVYAIWIVEVVLLYPACKWFAAVKRRRKDWWLSYL